MPSATISIAELTKGRAIEAVKVYQSGQDLLTEHVNHYVTGWRDRAGEFGGSKTHDSSLRGISGLHDPRFVANSHAILSTHVRWGNKCAGSGPRREWKLCPALIMIQSAVTGSQQPGSSWLSGSVSSGLLLFFRSTLIRRSVSSSL